MKIRKQLARFKRRALSALLSLALTFSLLPVITVPAAAAQTFNVLTFDELKSACQYEDAVINVENNFAIVNYPQSIRVAKNVKLCLQDHKITIETSGGNPFFIMQSDGGSLTVTGKGSISLQYSSQYAHSSVFYAENAGSVQLENCGIDTNGGIFSGTGGLSVRGCVLDGDIFYGNSSNVVLHSGYFLGTIQGNGDAKNTPLSDIIDPTTITARNFYFTAGGTLVTRSELSRMIGSSEALYLTATDDNLYIAEHDWPVSCQIGTAYPAYRPTAADGGREVTWSETDTTGELAKAGLALDANTGVISGTAADSLGTGGEYTIHPVIKAVDNAGHSDSYSFDIRCGGVTRVTELYQLIAFLSGNFSGTLQLMNDLDGYIPDHGAGLHKQGADGAYLQVKGNVTLDMNGHTLSMQTGDGGYESLSDSDYGSGHTKSSPCGYGKHALFHVQEGSTLNVTGNGRLYYNDTTTYKVEWRYGGNDFDGAFLIDKMYRYLDPSYLFYVDGTLNLESGDFECGDGWRSYIPIFARKLNRQDNGICVYSSEIGKTVIRGGIYTGRAAYSDSAADVVGTEGKTRAGSSRYKESGVITGYNITVMAGTFDGRGGADAIRILGGENSITGGKFCTHSLELLGNIGYMYTKAETPDRLNSQYNTVEGQTLRADTAKYIAANATVKYGGKEKEVSYFDDVDGTYKKTAVVYAPAPTLTLQQPFSIYPGTQSFDVQATAAGGCGAGHYTYEWAVKKVGSESEMNNVPTLYADKWTSKASFVWTYTGPNTSYNTAGDKYLVVCQATDADTGLKSDYSWVVVTVAPAHGRPACSMTSAVVNHGGTKTTYDNPTSVQAVAGDVISFTGTYNYPGSTQNQYNWHTSDDTSWPMTDTAETSGERTYTYTVPANAASPSIRYVSFFIRSDDGQWDSCSVDISVGVPDSVTFTTKEVSFIRGQYATQDLKYDAVVSNGLNFSIDESTPLPDGLALKTWNGRLWLEGEVPSAKGVGVYPVTVNAKDRNGVLIRANSMSINVYDTPAIATTVLPDGAVGDAYGWTLQLSNTEYTSGDISWSLVSGTGSLPGGLTLDATTGVISGTPTQPNLSSFTVAARDNRTGHGTTQSLSINVNGAPEIDTIDASSSTGWANADGKIFTYTTGAYAWNRFEASGGADITAKLADGSALPSWLTFEADGVGYWALHGSGDYNVVPAGTASTSIDIVLTADCGLSGTATAALTVTLSNAPQFLTSDTDLAKSLHYNGGTVNAAALVGQPVVLNIAVRSESAITWSVAPAKKCPAVGSGLSIVGTGQDENGNYTAAVTLVPGEYENETGTNAPLHWYAAEFTVTAANAAGNKNKEDYFVEVIRSVVTPTAVTMTQDNVSTDIATVYAGFEMLWNKHSISFADNGTPLGDYTVTGLPAGLKLWSNNGGNGRYISGTTTAADGDYPITVTVTNPNNGKSISKNFTIRVTSKISTIGAPTFDHDSGTYNIVNSLGYLPVRIQPSDPSQKVLEAYLMCRVRDTATGKYLSFYTSDSSYYTYPDDKNTYLSAKSGEMVKNKDGSPYLRAVAGFGAVPIDNTYDNGFGPLRITRSCTVEVYAVGALDDMYDSPIVTRTYTIDSSGLQAISILTTTLPAAAAGTETTSAAPLATLSSDVSGVTWSGTGLPVGMNLSSDGKIYGITYQEGTFPVTVTAVLDGTYKPATKTLNLTVNKGTTATYEKPTVTIKSDNKAVTSLTTVYSVSSQDRPQLYANVSQYSTNLDIRWYRIADSGESVLVGTGSNMYVPNNVLGTAKYFATATYSPNGNYNNRVTGQSDPVTVNVIDRAGEPQFMDTAPSTTGLLGGAAMGFSETISSPDDGTLTCRWYRCKKDTASNTYTNENAMPTTVSKDSEGNTIATLMLTADAAGTYYYRCMAVNTNDAAAPGYRTATAYGAVQTVEVVSSKYVTDLEITAWKTKYTAGSTISDDDLTVVATYNDGTTGVYKDYSIFPARGTELTKGNDYIVVSAAGKTESGEDKTYSASANITVSDSGYTVSGTVTGWNAADDAVIRLYDSTVADADIKTDIQSAAPASGTAVTEKGTPALVSGSTTQYSQTFSFGTVAAGSYKLAVFKPRGTANKPYVPKIVTVTVTDAAVDTGELKLWLYGDVNCDGTVSSGDLLQVNRKIAGKSSIFDSGDDATKAFRFEAANITAIKNNDTELTSADVLQYNRYLAHKTSMFDLLP